MKLRGRRSALPWTAPSTRRSSGSVHPTSPGASSCQRAGGGAVGAIARCARSGMTARVPGEWRRATRSLAGSIAPRGAAGPGFACAERPDDAVLVQSDRHHVDGVDTAPVAAFLKPATPAARAVIYAPSSLSRSFVRPVKPQPFVGSFYNGPPAQGAQPWPSAVAVSNGCLLYT